MSNCKVIALTNQKGGVGKTTTAVNLGVGLAKQGKRVLLIDADAQANLTMALGYSRPDDLPITLSTIMQNIIDDKSFDVSQGILSHSEGVDLLPSNIELSGFEVRLINAMSRERVLKTYVNEVKKNYDYVLIDCMPSLGMITINALAAADSVVIPTQPHYLSAKGLELLLRSVSMVKRQINPKLRIDGILMTMVMPRTNISKEITATVKSAYGQKIKVFDTEIPHSIRAVEATAEGKSIFAYDKGGKVAAAYERVGDTYVINEEQAETVRMIFDLYLQGFGSMKIAQILTEHKRKTATGLIKWSVSNIMRAIKNATYTGTKCYNKSRSNNFLEQKRINNLDMSTYEYIEGDFPAIVSQEIWDKAQAIRESRMKPALVSTEKTTHSKRDSRDIWVNKLRCSCGSSYRKNKWHTKLDGKTSYGYQCYNQLNNGIRRKRAEIGLDTEGYCDSRMITDWKLDFMAKALLEHLWEERKESVLIALDLIRHYYKEERTLDNKSDAASIQSRIDKANSRLTNLIAMRADGEISKDEYQSMRSPIDTELKELQKALEDTPTNKGCPRGLDLEGIRSTLNSLIDFSGSTISHDVINQFVYMVTPTSDTTFDWYVNLNGTADVKATFTAEGRKKSCIIKLEEIEKISSVHRKENEDNAHLIKNPIVFTFLHRLPSRTRSKKRIQRTTIRIDSKRPANMAGRLLSIIARVVLQDVLRFAIIKKNHRYDAVIGRDSLWATAIFC